MTGFVLGVLLASLVFRYLTVPRVRARAYQVCQASARVEHGRWPAEASGFNTSAVPEQRHRSPDRKTERQPAPLRRPVFHD